MNSKDTPLHTVLFGMFPNAMKALARHSKFGSDKHNPGEPLHWAFDKSTAHAECLCSHLAQAATVDPETGESHTVAAFWRAAALLETELVRGGATPGFAVKFAQAVESDEASWVVQFNSDPSVYGGQWTPSSAMSGTFSSKTAADAAIDAYCKREGYESDRHEWRSVKVSP